MKYLHTMVRVTDLDQSLRFYCDALACAKSGAGTIRRGASRSSSSPRPATRSAQVELTHNWDPEEYGIGRAFGHLAYEVDDIYAACRRLQEHGVTINRPPRDGRMAFVRSPDQISVELLQKGEPRAARAEPGAACPTPASGSVPTRWW